MAISESACFLQLLIPPAFLFSSSNNDEKVVAWFCACSNSILNSVTFVIIY